MIITFSQRRTQPKTASVDSSSAVATAAAAPAPATGNHMLSNNPVGKVPVLHRVGSI